MTGYYRLRVVAALSAVSSLVQGLVWAALAVLAMLAYECIFQPNTSNYTFTDYLIGYFQDGSCNETFTDDIGYISVSNPQKLLIVSVIVGASNFLMSLFGCALLISMRTSKQQVVVGWSLALTICAFFVCVADAIAFAIITVDYESVDNSNGNHIGVNGLVLLVLMVIAARGGYLWLVNAALAVYLSLCIFRAGCTNTEEEEPRPSTSRLHGQINPSFQFDKNELNDPVRLKYDYDYPPHTALARWPQLRRSGRDFRYPSYTAFARWPQLTRKSITRDSWSRLTSHQVRSRKAKSFPMSIAPPPPPLPPLDAPPVHLPEMSLREAVSVRQLKKVRPPLPKFEY